MLLNQITIPCTDYDASVAFYTRLGLTQIVDAPPRYARFEISTGEGATLSIHKTRGPARCCQRDGRDWAEAINATDEQGTFPVPVFPLLTRSDPLGGHDVCAVPAVAAECRRPAL